MSAGQGEAVPGEGEKGLVPGIIEEDDGVAQQDAGRDQEADEDRNRADQECGEMAAAAQADARGRLKTR